MSRLGKNGKDMQMRYRPGNARPWKKAVGRSRGDGHARLAGQGK